MAKIYARGLTQREYQKEAIRRKKWHKELAAELTAKGYGTFKTDRVDYELIYTVLKAVAPHTLQDTVTNHEESESSFFNRLKNAFYDDERFILMRNQKRRIADETKDLLEDKIRKEVKEEFANPTPT